MTTSKRKTSKKKAASKAKPRAKKKKVVKKAARSTLQAIDQLDHVATSKLEGMGSPWNPRRISDKELADLRRSMKFFGPVVPIVCNRRSGNVVGGHQRIRAAALEEIKSLPVVWVDLDEPSEKQLNLALNKITGEWEETELRELFKSLEAAGADLELTGFSTLEMENLFSDSWAGRKDVGPGDVGGYDATKESVTVRVPDVPLPLKDEVVDAIQEAVNQYGLSAAAF